MGARVLERISHYSHLILPLFSTEKSQGSVPETSYPVTHNSHFSLFTVKVIAGLWAIRPHIHFKMNAAITNTDISGIIRTKNKIATQKNNFSIFLFICTAPLDTS